MHVPKPTIYEEYRKYFSSRRYMSNSALFGTMVCFFLVGMRIEAILLNTGVIKDNDNTYHLEPRITFWIELFLFSCFLVADTIMLYMFRPNAAENNTDRKTYTAAIIDFCINSACLSFLVVAELQRCCDEDAYDSYRFLAGAYDEKDSSYGDDNYGYDKIEIECCPAFGSRLYGGVGMLEPFTSLVALRIFRFWLSKRIVQYLDKRYGWSEFQRSMERQQSVRNPLDPLYIVKENEGHGGGHGGGDHGHGHGGGEFTEEVGTIIDLWKTALARYPDIVAKYGEFSGELLQSMLGIEVIEGLHTAEPPKNVTVEDEEKQLSSGCKSSGIPLTLEIHGRDPAEQAPHALLSSQADSRRRPSLGLSKGLSTRIGQQYKGLSPAAQSIIMAGKTGKRVRTTGESKYNASRNFEVSGTISCDHTKNMASAVESTFDGSLTEGLQIPGPLSQVPEFHIVADDDHADEFFAPNARLVRSIRRCDRKLLPYVDQWSVVDVAMTKFEIVYFEVSDADKIEEEEEDGEDRITIAQRVKDVKSAITATRGGKGLRIRDVAYGRKIVGRLEFSSIEAIQVERIMPHGISDEGIYDYDSHISDEYWKDNPIAIEPSVRHVRWSKVKEDRLKLETGHSTLYLRFYSDLDNCEHNIDRVMRESETEGPLFKNNAFQWCQTIGRLVGTSLLQQTYLGGGNQHDELRDYLIVAEPENTGNQGFRFASIGVLPGLSKTFNNRQNSFKREKSKKIQASRRSDNSNSNTAESRAARRRRFSTGAEAAQLKEDKPSKSSKSLRKVVSSVDYRSGDIPSEIDPMIRRPPDNDDGGDFFEESGIVC